MARAKASLLNITNVFRGLQMSGISKTKSKSMFTGHGVYLTSEFESEISDINFLIGLSSRQALIKKSYKDHVLLLVHCTFSPLLGHGIS